MQSVQIDSHIASKPTEAVSQDANGDCASSSDEEDEVPIANETNDVIIVYNGFLSCLMSLNFL